MFSMFLDSGSMELFILPVHLQDQSNDCRQGKDTVPYSARWAICCVELHNQTPISRTLVINNFLSSSQ